MTKDSPRTSVLRDEELIARLLGWARDIQTGSTAIWAMDQDLKSAADRIEQLVATNEALSAKLATCEKYRDAYAECDRIGTQAVRDLEVKLAECEARLGKAVEALEDVHRFGVITHPARATLAEIKGESHD